MTIYFKKVVAGTIFGDLHAFDQNLVLIKNISGAHTGFITQVLTLSNGNIATCNSHSYNFSVKIWNPTNNAWTLVTTFFKHSQGIYGLEEISNTTIASGDLGGSIYLWLNNNGTITQNFINSAGVMCLRLLKSGYLAIGSGPSVFSIGIWNYTSKTVFKTLTGHTDYANYLLEINTNLLASASRDFTIIIWDLTAYTLKYKLIGHKSYVNILTLITYDILASGSSDNTVKLWNTTNWTLITNLTSNTAAIFRSISLYSNDIFVTGGTDKTLRLWQISTLQLINTTSTNNISIASLNTYETSKFNLILKIFQYFL